MSVLPPSVEYAAVQLAVMNTTPPPFAPLGSAQEAGATPGLQFVPADVRPVLLFTLNTTAAAGASFLARRLENAKTGARLYQKGWVRPAEGLSWNRRTRHVYFISKLRRLGWIGRS